MPAKSAVLLLAALALPAPVVAGAQTSADAMATAKPKPERKTCRTTDTTGTIMGGTKVCHTKSEWAAIDQRNGDNAANGRDLNGNGGNRQGGGFN